MTDAWLMEADCLHGVVWFECRQCFYDRGGGDMITDDTEQAERLTQVPTPDADI